MSYRPHAQGITRFWLSGTKIGAAKRRDAAYIGPAAGLAESRTMEHGFSEGKRAQEGFDREQSYRPRNSFTGEPPRGGLSAGSRDGARIARIAPTERRDDPGTLIGWIRAPVRRRLRGSTLGGFSWMVCPEHVRMNWSSEADRPGTVERGSGDRRQRSRSRTGHRGRGRRCSRFGTVDSARAPAWCCPAMLGVLSRALWGFVQGGVRQAAPAPAVLRATGGPKGSLGIS